MVCGLFFTKKILECFFFSGVTTLGASVGVVGLPWLFYICCRAFNHNSAFKYDTVHYWKSEKDCSSPILVLTNEVAGRI